MQPLISVLVPVYNMQDYLDRCVASICAQTWGNLDIVLVDDGSTDNSAALCDAWQRKDGRIRVIHQPNGGLSAARNTGLEQARGQWLTHVDADDWIEPDAVRYLYQLCQTHQVALAAANHRIVTAGGSAARFPETDTVRVLTLREAFDGALYDRDIDVCVWNKLYRRDLMDGLRYPVGRLYEDTSLFAEVMARAGTVVCGGQVQYNYLVRDDSISRAAFTPAKMDYITAVDDMTAKILSICPDMTRGCTRRKAHALLSVRRYFVGCGKALAGRRRDIEARIRPYVAPVLSDPRAPRRDKAGLLAVALHLYDPMWRVYEKRRGRA